MTDVQGQNDHTGARKSRRAFAYALKSCPSDHPQGKEGEQKQSKLLEYHDAWEFMQQILQRVPAMDVEKRVAEGVVHLAHGR